MTAKLIVYSDGGARGNPGPAAIGIAVYNEKGEILKEHSETIGRATNNVAEYTALAKALEMASQLGGEQIDCYLDSELTVNQLTGKYRVKTPHLKPLFLQVKDKEKKFRAVTYRQITREHEKIRYVDKLLNQALNREGF